jgi:hypothetical protein
MKWVSYVEMPMSILIDNVFECDEQAEVAAALAYEKSFYSAHYFKCIKEVLRVPATSKCLYRTLEKTLELLQLQKHPDYFVSQELLLQCAGLQNRYTFELICQQLQELVALSGRSFLNIQLVCLLEWANKNKRENWEAVKVVVKTLSPTASADDIATALEDSVKLVDIAREKEEKVK